MLESIFFLYVFFGIWIFLGLSIVFTLFALAKRDWKWMLAACVLSVPNTIFVMQPLELVMYLLLVWFIVQLYLLFRLYKY